jgi:hypothetical protein
MGAAKVFRATFQKTALKPGDEIHWLVGGVFGIRKSGGQPATGQVQKPDLDRSPFERDSGKRSGDGLEALVKSKKLEEITRDEAIKAKYNLNLSPPKKF